MEHHGTGGPSLEPRVKQLETGFADVVRDLHSVQTDVSAVKQSQAVISQQITDGFANLYRRQSESEQKLDETRTKRPELGALASVAAVILTLVGAIMWPAYERMNRLEGRDLAQQQTLSQRGVVIGEFASDRRHMETELGQLRADVNAMQSNRFTKLDGQRLEDKIDRLHHPGN